MIQKLNKYAENFSSQYGEDGITRYIIANAKGPINKSCCEVGAGDGETLSNTHMLRTNHQWSAVLIEGEIERFKRLSAKFGGIVNNFVLKSTITPKGLDSLDEIFTRYNLEFDIGLLSIDIDSHDYHVWKNLQKVNPQIVIIEYNNHIPSYIDYHDPEGELFLRCSAKALERLGQQKGYALICCTVTNCIFIKNDLFNPEKFPDMPVEGLFDYEGQRRNGTIGRVVITSQMITSYPVFSDPPPLRQRFICHMKAVIKSVLRKQERYIKPSIKVRKALTESFLFY